MHESSNNANLSQADSTHDLLASLQMLDCEVSVPLLPDKDEYHLSLSQLFPMSPLFQYSSRSLKNR